LFAGVFFAPAFIVKKTVFALYFRGSGLSRKFFKKSTEQFVAFAHLIDRTRKSKKSFEWNERKVGLW